MSTSPVGTPGGHLFITIYFKIGWSQGHYIPLYIRKPSVSNKSLMLWLITTKCIHVFRKCINNFYSSMKIFFITKKGKNVQFGRSAKKWHWFNQPERTFTSCLFHTVLQSQLTIFLYSVKHLKELLLESSRTVSTNGRILLFYMRGACSTCYSFGVSFSI